MTVFFFFFWKDHSFWRMRQGQKKKKKTVGCFCGFTHTDMKVQVQGEPLICIWSHMSDLMVGLFFYLFFFFFLRKESLSLLCGWQAQAIYIYISAISLLSSFILLLHFFSISSHLPSTIPSLSVSLPLFFSAGIHFLYIRVPFFFFYFLPLCHLSLSVFPAFSLPCGHAGSFSWSARTL